MGPSGTGKTTLIKKIQDKYPDFFEFSISHTVRKIREGEINGKDYHFLSENEFKQVDIELFRI